MNWYTCDDGNTISGDGCDSNCQTEAYFQCAGGDQYGPDVCVEVCGDGFNYGINECDDWNFEDGDGCNSTCFIETGWYCVTGAGATPTLA